jgi:hypothetical protein
VCTPSCCICWNSSNAFCPCPHFHMSQYHGSPVDHIMWGHFVEHSPRILYAPTFGIHIHEATGNTNTWFTQSHCMICVWMRLPSSSACNPAHALSTQTKVSSLLIAFVEKAPLPSEVAQPEHIL